MHIVSDRKLQDYVESELYHDQSPGAIAGRLNQRSSRLTTVSKDTIYRYIKSVYGRKIEYYRNQLRSRRRRKKPRTKPWSDRTFINMRPKIINKRRRVGDAEGDFVVSGKSGKGILLVVVDRKSRVTFLELILKPSQVAVTRSCLRIKRRYPEWKTMTFDNDILLQHHHSLAVKLGIKIYFCFPGHAWEKAQVENTNRYIRRYVPKGSNISRFLPGAIKKLEAWLNRRYLKVLNYATPQEILDVHRKLKKHRRAFKR